MTELYFSLAKFEDVQSIVEINNSYIGSSDPGGFLVIPLDEEHVRNLIESGDERYFLAKDKSSNLLGYAEVAKSMDLTLLNDMNWLTENLKELAESILSGEYVYVKQLAVRKGYQRQGVATFIYDKMEESIGCPVVVFTANKPKRNDASILFHEKNGYIRVSRLYRTDFGEFAEYESFFYVKNY